jgi:hypothetical protein
MPTPRENFQSLLKKLFQFDCAELDFGIYRIMNQKRAISFVAGARSLDPVFKRRLFNEE